MPLPAAAIATSGGDGQPVAQIDYDWVFDGLYVTGEGLTTNFTVFTVINNTGSSHTVIVKLYWVNGSGSLVEVATSSPSPTTVADGETVAVSGSNYGSAFQTGAYYARLFVDGATNVYKRVTSTTVFP